MRALNWTPALYSSGTVHSAQTGTLSLKYACWELCFSSVHLLWTDLNLWLEIISVYCYCYYFTRASAVGLSSCYCSLSLSAHVSSCCLFMMKIVHLWQTLVCFFILFISPREETETHFYKNRSVAPNVHNRQMLTKSINFTAVQDYLMAVNPYTHVQTRSHCRYAHVT